MISFAHLRIIIMGLTVYSRGRPRGLLGNIRQEASSTAWCQVKVD